MSENLTNPKSLPENAPLVRTANEELSSKIFEALKTAGYIAPSDKDAAMTLLASGAVKAGDWRNLLEKNIAANSNKPVSHAKPHHPA